MIPSEANSYDTVPYRSLAFAQTHPDRLATMARMFGLSPANIASCRVLELGCANGGNLIPMAFDLPDSRFVGVDLSRRHVDDAQRAIAALGMRNIAIEHASIVDIDRSWGSFDYIICHGVYSWVEPSVQERILEIVSDNLTANGVAYISYNTYPGWHLREGIRHMMRYHAARFEHPQQQVEQARALLSFLVSASQDMGPYGELLSREADGLSSADDSYLYHGHLEQTNSPLYFHQFIERAEAAGLQYLSEADITDMLTALFPPAVAETLERISPDILHLEQFMDFVRNRQFRQTLLCHRELRPTRRLSPAILHGLFVSSRAVADSSPTDLTSGTSVTFSTGRRRAEVTGSATKAALTILMEEWPQAVDVDTLCRTAIDRAAPFLSDVNAEQACHSTMTDLFGCVTHGLITLHSRPPRCANRVSERPRAHPVVRFMLDRGNVVVNARHEMVQLEPLAVEVMKLADGQRSQGEMLDVLVERVKSGAIALSADDAPVPTGQALREWISDQVSQTLGSPARSGLLVG